jgi:sugar lactone lactonase YvrE
MRSFIQIIAGAWLLFAASNAFGGASPAPGYEIEIVSKPGAIFGSLTRDGDAIVVTDLAEGQLLRRGPDGQFVAFGPALPHGLDVFGDPIGPYKAARRGANYLVAQGGTPIGKDDSPNDHALLEVDGTSVVKVVQGDFWNPFDFVADGGTLYVVDASRNDVERLRADGSDKTILFTFARLKAKESKPAPASPAEVGKQQTEEVAAVPTGITIRNGRIYLSLFAGFPYIAGSGRVVSLPAAEEAQSARIEALDLNAPVDVAFDPNGRLLVLEHGAYDQAAGWAPGSGRLLAIELASGDRQVLVDGLTQPVGVLVFDANQIVVSQLDGNLIFLKGKAP